MSAHLHLHAQVLYHFHTAQHGRHHCRLPVTWQLFKPHCCGESNWRGEKMDGRRSGGDMHGWPLWLARVNESACAVPGLSRREAEGPDLSRKHVTWAALGIALDPSNVSLVEKA